MKLPQEIIEKIKSLITPTIIAVSGFGGSGNSTVATNLSELLNAPLIGIDQFMKDRDDESYSCWNGMDFNRFENEVLIPFTKSMNPISYGHWDHGTNTIIKNIEVLHKDVLILEGVGLFRPELMKYFSYTIWVDVPQEEAMRRGKKRDREVYDNPQDEKWDGIWKRNDTEYFSTYKPDKSANHVFRND